MINKKIQLWNNDSNVTITTYLLDNSNEIRIKKRPAIIICPGGGYLNTSDREAEPIAMKFAAEGYNAFVLRYSTYSKNNDDSKDDTITSKKALIDLAKAILTIRENSEEWSIDSDKIILCGFSAGAHLCASLGVHCQDKFLQESFNDTDNKLFKPNALILGYPLLDFNVINDTLSNIDNDRLKGFWQLMNQAIFGVKNPNKEQLNKLSPVNYVTTDTPPTFMWHTAGDNLVYPRNSMNFAIELDKNKVPYELHIFEKGDHALSLCNEVTAHNDNDINSEAEVWFSMAIAWLKNHIK